MACRAAGLAAARFDGGFCLIGVPKPTDATDAIFQDKLPATELIARL
jgi:hypothetical protein